MSEFLAYFQIGLHHVLNSQAYDHLLFLVALTIPYALKDWKKVVLLSFLFTIGHTASLILAIFEIVVVKTALLEFSILLTILATAFFNFFKVGKSFKNDSISVLGLITFIFGIIHGLGFSNYLKSLLEGAPTEKLVPTLEFAIGIEAAQIIIIVSVLLLSYIAQSFFRINRKDMILIVSSLIIGVLLPMLLQFRF
jgi:HupE / UreJ protein